MTIHDFHQDAPTTPQLLPSLLLAHPRLSREDELDMVRRYQSTGDKKALAALVSSYQPYVMSIARTYARYGHDIDDLLQAGNLGFIRALDSYEPERGLRLMTYAAHWVRNEMSEYALRNDRLVNRYTTKHLRKLFFNRSTLTDRSGKLVPAEQVAAHLDVPVKAVREVQEHLGGRDMPYDLQDGEWAPVDYLQAQDADPADAIERDDWAARLAEALDAALAALSERERDIVRRRFTADQPATLQELADDYGVSGERIRQLEKRSLERLREALAPGGWC